MAARLCVSHVLCWLLDILNVCALRVYDTMHTMYIARLSLQVYYLFSIARTRA
jgi:hypothetical protein